MIIIGYQTETIITFVLILENLRVKGKKLQYIGSWWSIIFCVRLIWLARYVNALKHTKTNITRANKLRQVLLLFLFYIIMQRIEWKMHMSLYTEYASLKMKRQKWRHQFNI